MSAPEYGWYVYVYRDPTRNRNRLSKRERIAQLSRLTP
jgi:hypothetical protein